MSPALFTLFSDLHSRMLDKAEQDKTISRVKVYHTSPFTLRGRSGDLYQGK